MTLTYRSLFSFFRENIFYKVDYHFSHSQLEIFRILVAVFCIVNFSTILLDYNVFLAPNGLVGWEVTNANSFWFELHPQKIADLLGVLPGTIMVAVCVVYLSALGLLLFGVLPNLSALVSLVCFTLITVVISPYAYGVDVYQSVCLFFLCFFPIGYSYAVLEKKKKKNLAVLQALSVRVLQLYLIITYLSAGFEKAAMSGWWNGKFIFFLVNDPTIVSSSLIPKSAPVFVYLFFGVVVVLSESLYFVLIWLKATRLWIFLAVVSMHVFIALFMDLMFFGILLTILNICCWYPAIVSDLKRFRV